MPRLMLLTLGTVAALIFATPAGAAVKPTTLPAIAKTLSAKKGCTSTSYRAPRTGFLDVRLRGSGDWDLMLRDVAGRTLAASRGFGGREVVQTRVRAGQRLTAVGCRASGAGRTARTTFRLTSATLPKLTGALQLLRVRGNEKQIAALERARARRDARARAGLRRRDRRRRQGPCDRDRLRAAPLGPHRRPDQVLRRRARRRSPLCDAGRPGRHGAADGPHDLPHLRGGPERAQGPRRQQPRPRAQGRLRDVLPGSRDVRRRDLQERQRARRPARVLRHGRAPRARVARDGGGDGARPPARPAARTRRASAPCSPTSAS